MVHAPDPLPLGEKEDEYGIVVARSVLTAPERVFELYIVHPKCTIFPSFEENEPSGVINCKSQGATPRSVTRLALQFCGAL